MRKLVSPMSGKILKINVKVGQVISEDDEVLIMKSMTKTCAAKCESGSVKAKEHEEHDEFPRYHNLYEYSINESLDLLAQLISGNQFENPEKAGVGI